MKGETSQRRKRGRPPTRKDQNGLPVTVRPDRDRLMRWFFDDVPRSALDEAMQSSGNKRFYRLHDALHDDAYRNTLPGTLCRRFGISWPDLMELWRSYNRDLGLMIMANNLPQVMEGIAIDDRDESQKSLAAQHRKGKAVRDGVGKNVGSSRKFGVAWVVVELKTPMLATTNQPVLITSLGLQKIYASVRIRSAPLLLFSCVPITSVTLFAFCGKRSGSGPFQPLAITWRLRTPY